MSNEQKYYDALKRIAKAYAAPDVLKRKPELRGGLDYVEGLEMAYDNIQAEAATAIRGHKRPVEKKRRPVVDLKGAIERATPAYFKGGAGGSLSIAETEKIAGAVERWLNGDRP